jgi:hypothetical protein
MRKSKWIKILASIGIVFLIVFVVIPPFTRRWYRNHLMKYAPPIPVNSWKKFASDEGKFSVWFPGTPEETAQPLHNLIGEIDAHSFVVKADIQDFYAVVYGDIPPTVDLQDPSNLFDKAQAMEANQNGSGKIVFQQEIKLKDYPGREFEFAAGGKANYSGRIRIFLVGRRLYVLTIVFLTANPHLEDRENFFNSFKLQN